MKEYYVADLLSPFILINNAENRKRERGGDIDYVQIDDIHIHTHISEFLSLIDQEIIAFGQVL